MKKRIISCILAAGLLMTALAGCGGSGSAGTKAAPDGGGAAGSGQEAGAGGLDLSKEVNLVMYIVSDRPAGQDVVDENFNKLLKEKMNTTLTLNWIPWADYSNKYPLLFSSGEEFDMAYTSNWLNWTQLARKGAFMNLDSLWPVYAPDNFAAASEQAKREALIDGSYYVVPTQLATYHGYGPIYRTRFENGAEYTGEAIKDFVTLESYLDWVRENVPGIQPFDVYAEGSQADDVWMYEKGYNSAKGATNEMLFYDPTQENPKLITLYEYEEVGEFLAMMNRWNQKGFFSKSALSDTDGVKTQNGLAATRLHNIDTYAEHYAMHPDWGFKYASFVKHNSHLPYTQDSMAIAHTSKNPERAMAFWNLLTTDRELYDAFYFGVLGTTYELNEAGEFRLLDTNQYMTTSMWAVRTNELHRVRDGYPADYNPIREQWEKDIAADPSSERFASFVIDTSNIETEYAACLGVHQQYWWPLELGYTDPVAGLAEYRSKMEAAGIDKVREEIQKQLDAYVAAMQ